MANEQHVQLLKKGVRGWNEWRRLNPLSQGDLRFADLRHADLRRADLRGAQLSHAYLARAYLTNADLVGANLTKADLIRADLSGANLERADLTEADLTAANLRETQLRFAVLSRANLSDANLTHADLSGANLTSANLTTAHLRLTNLTHATLTDGNLDGASLGDTLLCDVDLRGATGLDDVRHRGPSSIDHRTLVQSGSLPLPFLRGCGLPDQLIDYLNAATVQFYSCFISYSTADQDFADRLHADLQARGIRCWFAPHDMRPGRKIHDQIDEAIRVYDRLLLILSKESMSSEWVRTEIEKARQKELSSKHHVLFPLALVPYSDIRAWQQFNVDLGEDTARVIREYFLPDFSAWKINHDAYQRSFEKMVAALARADGVGSDLGHAARAQPQGPH
jgi:uncharacterized protein YjbI with pentapeptide repeats